MLTKTLNYLTFQTFEYDRTQRLFQERFVRMTFDLSNTIIPVQQCLHFSAQRRSKCTHKASDEVHNIIWISTLQVA